MIRIRDALLLIAAISGCSEEHKAEPVKAPVVVKEEVAFDYRGKHCKVISVEEPHGSWSYVYLRFVDCGDGVVNGQFPAGKEGMR